MNDELNYASQIAYSSKEVLQFTYDQAVKYRDSPGVYVECGVAAGAQIIAMAAGAPNKTIYAFDSFEGIPLPSNKDNQYPGIKLITKEEQSKLPNPGEQILESSGATSVSIEDFWNHLKLTKANKNVCAIDGWFELTVPRKAKEIEPISILRLDGDLYNSTYVCLKYLYPKVIKGGLVIVDDWFLPGCRDAVLDYFGMSVPDIKLINGIDSTMAYWIRAHASRSTK